MALLRSGIWVDFEEWPKAGPLPPIRTATKADAKVDWVVYRKLLTEQTTPEQIENLGQSLPFYKRPFVTAYTTSPYLDLTQPLNCKKSAIAHIYRTERKLTREVGAPVLREFNTPEERAEWFEWYVAFQRVQNRISDEQYEILKKWTQDGEKPEWMHLTGLMVNDVPLAMGLFYYSDGVFYYFSSTMSPDPQYRKYGPGKLFVEKLIQQTITRGGRTFDFLQGEHNYKAHWNPTNRVLYQCIYPHSPKGLIALMLFKLKKMLRKDNVLTTPLEAPAQQDPTPAFENIQSGLG
ncbi:MAG: GNAT family N-acetyltransferase [Deltaproteobacteria bacterium]|nr:GNAT family N-acetyltransferase [Deltaproteobacteria bacterium]